MKLSNYLSQNPNLFYNLKKYNYFINQSSLIQTIFFFLVVLIAITIIFFNKDGYLFFPFDFVNYFCFFSIGYFGSLFIFKLYAYLRLKFFEMKIRKIFNDTIWNPTNSQTYYNIIKHSLQLSETKKYEELFSQRTINSDFVCFVSEIFPIILQYELKNKENSLNENNSLTFFEKT